MSADYFYIPGGPVLPSAGSPSGGGGGVWGAITGTIGDQTDLETELDAKLDLDGSTTMTGGLKLQTVAAASATNGTLFFDSSNSDLPSFKDSGGTVFDLTDNGTILGP